MELILIGNILSDAIDGLISAITSWCCGAFGLGAVIVGATVFLYLKKRKSKKHELND